MPSTRTLIMGVPWDQQRVKNVRCLVVETSGQVVWDERHDAFDTWQRVLAEAGGDAVIILEDDVVPTERWREKIEAVIAGHPTAVIQFFSNRVADLLGSHWEPGRKFRMNQCYYLPAGTAAMLLEYSYVWHERHPEHPTGYDLTMADWLHSRKPQLRYWQHVPSLVQHLPWQSAIGSRSRGRQSRTFQ